MLCCHTSLVLLSSVQKENVTYLQPSSVATQHTNMTLIGILALYFWVCSQILFRDPNSVVMPMSSLYQRLNKNVLVFS